MTVVEIVCCLHWTPSVAAFRRVIDPTNRLASSGLSMCQPFHLFTESPIYQQSCRLAYKSPIETSGFCPGML